MSALSAVGADAPWLGMRALTRAVLNPLERCPPYIMRLAGCIAWVRFLEGRQRISMAAALAYRWDGKRSRLYFQAREGSYNQESLIEYLRELRRHFAGQQDPARVRSSQHLLFGFLRGTGMEL